MELSASKMKRRVEIGRLLYRYGRADVVRVVGLDEAALELDSAEEPSNPEQLASDLEAMGATFIKAGQMLSTRPDLVAPAYITELERLQDNVEPISFSEVEAIVEEELGFRISRGFASFDAEPLGCASLSQVHAATLRSGREVVVKVQRPGTREQVMEDLEVLGEMARLAGEHTDIGQRYGVADMFSEFRRSLMRELDFSREARNLEAIRTHVEDYPLLVVPGPILEYSTSRVLTMERIHGQNIGKLSPLSRLEVDGDELAQSLVKSYLDLILVHGVFNADPHPGNLLLTGDGRLALIDMGMIAYLTPETRERVLRLLLAVSEGDSDEAATICIRMGERLPDFDEADFRRHAADLLLPNRSLSFEQVNLGRLVMEMVKVSARAGLRPSSDLTLLGKTLLSLDESIAVLSPDLKPTEAIQSHTNSLMRKHLLRSASPGAVFQSALEMNEFVQRLPARANAILDRIADPDLQIKIDAFDEARFVEGMQKIANRITLGLVIAALIVGAALLSSVETSVTLFGYPALAFLCFVGAATGGALLVINILVTDLRASSRRRKG